MPFDMSKISKKDTTKLSTYDDYKKLSLSFYKSAHDYTDLIAVGTLSGLIGNKAIFMNIAFATELYLKALLLSQQVNFYDKNNIRHNERHQLYSLYCILPEWLRVMVKHRHPCTNEKKDNFEVALRDISDSFTILRYSAEYNGMSYNYTFAHELLTTLMAICEQNDFTEEYKMIVGNSF